MTVRQLNPHLGRQLGEGGGETEQLGRPCLGPSGPYNTLRGGEWAVRFSVHHLPDVTIAREWGSKRGTTMAAGLMIAMGAAARLPMAKMAKAGGGGCHKKMDAHKIHPAARQIVLRRSWIHHPKRRFSFPVTRFRLPVVDMDLQVPIPPPSNFCHCSHSLLLLPLFSSRPLRRPSS